MKHKTFPPQVYTKDELNRILMACGGHPNGLRNRAIIMMGYRCGLRCSEALALHRSDIALDQGHVLVQRGKGGKSRRIGLPDDAAAAVRSTWNAVSTSTFEGRWHASDAQNGSGPPNSAREWAFPTSTGAALRTSYIRSLLPRLARRANIAKRLHFHGLRHTFAWELSQEGVSMPIIQRALGHSSLNTTAVYLDHLAPHDVINATRNRA